MIRIAINFVHVVKPSVTFFFEIKLWKRCFWKVLYNWNLFVLSMSIISFLKVCLFIWCSEYPVNLDDILQISSECLCSRFFLFLLRIFKKTGTLAEMTKFSWFECFLSLLVKGDSEAINKGQSEQCGKYQTSSCLRIREIPARKQKQ